MSKVSTKTKASLLTNDDLSNDMFSNYADDTLRIKTITRQYKNMSIAKAFATFYNVNVADDVKKRVSEMMEQYSRIENNK